MPRKYTELHDKNTIEEHDSEDSNDGKDVEFEELDTEGKVIDRVRKRTRKQRICRYFCWTLGVCILLQIIVFTIIVLAMKGYVDLPYIHNSTNTSATTNMIANTSAIFVLRAMDNTADPCTDFYQYACGGWINRYELPDDEASHTRSFGSLRDANTAMLNELMQSSELEYVSPAYRLCTDTTRLDERALTPIMPYYERIEATTDLDELMTLLGELSMEGLSLGAFFSLGVSVDDMNPNRYLLVLWQSGLTLPDASYYQSDTSNLSAWISSVFAVSPDGALSTTDIDDIVTLETQIAVIMYSASQNRDISQIYNNVTVTSARSTLGQLASYFDAFSLQSSEVINLAQLTYFQMVEFVVNRRSFATLKNYVKLKLYENTFHMLGSTQRDVSHSYKSMVFGTSSAKPRDEYCVSAINSAMPMLVGYHFVQQSNTSVEEARVILEAVEQSYSIAFEQLSWMDTGTAAGAQQKLEAITNKIGWPAVWPDFEEYYANVTFADYFEFQCDISRTAVSTEFRERHDLVDRSVWSMSPSAVNAYYSPSFNEIVFPLGILQFPFYLPGNVKAMNYGGLGVVQGHELSHGYDDSGSRYDANGYLRDWWTPASRTMFETEVQCVEQQFSRYQVAAGVNVQGSLVVGEALGDIGGVNNAYTAYQRWKANDYGTEEALVAQYFNMTGDELFFVSFAQVWCSVASPEYLEMLTSTNPHPPGQFRVQGTLTDTRWFSEVFGCAAGSIYNPSTSCNVW